MLLSAFYQYFPKPETVQSPRGFDIKTAISSRSVQQQLVQETNFDGLTAAKGPGDPGARAAVAGKAPLLFALISIKHLTHKKNDPGIKL